MSLGTARSCGPGAFCPHKGGLWFPSYFILPNNLLIQENRVLRGTYPAGWLHPVLFGDPQMTFLLAQDPHSGKKWVPTPPSVTIFPRSADLHQEVTRNIVGLGGRYCAADPGEAAGSGEMAALVSWVMGPVTVSTGQDAIQDPSSPSSQLGTQPTHLCLLVSASCPLWLSPQSFREQLPVLLTVCAKTGAQDGQGSLSSLPSLLSTKGAEPKVI